MRLYRIVLITVVFLLLRVVGLANLLAQSTPEPAAQTNTPHRVTAARLDNARKYTGPCPVIMHFTGRITTDGPGTVWFKISAGLSGKEGEGEVKFTAAGTRKVSKDLMVSNEPGAGSGSALLEAAMEDEDGRHSDSVARTSNHFEFDCGGGK